MFLGRGSKKKEISTPPFPIRTLPALLPTEGLGLRFGRKGPLAGWAELFWPGLHEASLPQSTYSTDSPTALFGVHAPPLHYLSGQKPPLYRVSSSAKPPVLDTGWEEPLPHQEGAGSEPRDKGANSNTRGMTLQYPGTWPSRALLLAVLQESLETPTEIRGPLCWGCTVHILRDNPCPRELMI